jgi:uncharacterized delta-60 repeat protein
MKLPFGLFVAIFLSGTTVSFSQVLSEDFKLITRGVGSLTATASGDNVFVYGDFDHLDGEYHGRLLLLNQNGEPVNGFADVFADGLILDVKTLPSGKLMVQGVFTHINGVETNNLARLNANGSLDESFHAAVNNVSDFDILSDVKVMAVVSGYLKKLNVDGSLASYPAFHSVSYSNILVAVDDVVYYVQAGTKKVIKVLSSGVIDSSFISEPPNGYVSGLALTPEGNILVYGFTYYNSQPRPLAVKINRTNGGLINEFNPIGLVSGFVRQAFVQADNSVILTGDITTAEGQRNLVKTSSTGEIIKSSLINDFESIYRISATTNGNFVLSGDVSYWNSNPIIGVTLIDAGLGSIASFSPEVSRVTHYYQSASLGPCGPLYVATVEHASFPFSNPLPPNVRMDESGNISAAPEANIVAVVLIQRDGKRIDYNARVRWNPDGTLDPSFSITHTGSPALPPMPGILKEFGGKIYLAGYQAGPIVLILNQNGSVHRIIDTLPGGSQISAMEIQSNGKVVLTGYIPIPGRDDAFVVIRLNPDGTLDESFNTNSYLGNIAASGVDDIAVDAYDRIYVSGYSSASYSFGLIRLNPDGTLDGSFNARAIGYDPAGFNGLGITTNLLEILPDNTVVLAGSFATYNGTNARSVVHINEQGEVIPMPQVAFGKRTSVTFLGYAAGSLYLRGYFINPDYTEVSAVAKIFFEESSNTPSTPPQFSGTIADSQITLSWEDKSNNELYYILQRSVAEGENGFVTIDTVDENINTAIDLHVTEATTYYYRVKAVNCAGDSPWSDIVSISTMTPPAPYFTAVCDSGNVSLSWSGNVSNDTKYFVERSSDLLQPFSQVIAVNAGIFSVVDDIPGEGMYHYRMRAQNSAGYSPYSDTVKILCVSEPAAPTSLKIVSTPFRSFDLTWTDASDNEMGFEVERTGDASSDTTVFVFATSFQDVSIHDSVSYTYRVRAVSQWLSSEWSAPSTITWSYILAAPNNLIANTIGGIAHLQWNDQSAVETHFVIQRSSGSSHYVDVVTLPANTGSWDDTTINPFEEYHYRVKAVYQLGSSSWSNAVPVSWQPGLSGTIELAIEETDGRVYQLRWTSDVSLVQYYIVERSLGNDKKFEPIDTVNVGTDTYVDTLKTVQAYYYRVVAHTPVGQVFSNQVWLLVTGASHDNHVTAQVYPTIFENLINVKTPSPSGDFVLFSPDGRESELTTTKTIDGFLLETPSVASGVYLLQFHSPSGVWVRKVIKL